MGELGPHHLDAAVGIAVFLDDQPLFAEGRRAVAGPGSRRNIYLSGDGPYPVGPPGGASGPAAMASFWFGQRTYVDGLTQETCPGPRARRWGLEAMAQVAETAWIQGVDLYAEIQPRLRERDRVPLRVGRQATRSPTGCVAGPWRSGSNRPGDTP
jgi:hypothetical protein